MKNTKYSGKYSKSFFTDNTIRFTGKIGENFSKYFLLGKNEAVLIYNFKELELLYAKGFKNVLGIEDEDVNMLMLNEQYDETSFEFTNEFHDRALIHLLSNKKNIKSFSSSALLRSKCNDIPIFMNLQVISTDEHGNLENVIARLIQDPTLNFTKIVQYNLNGDFDEDFIYNINHNLDFKSTISFREIDIIDKLKEGFNHIEIANFLGYSGFKVSAIIELMFKRFKVKSEKELIEFAEREQLIPNQFTNYFPPFV